MDGEAILTRYMRDCLCVGVSVSRSGIEGEGRRDRNRSVLEEVVNLFFFFSRLIVSGEIFGYYYQLVGDVWF